MALITYKRKAAIVFFLSVVMFGCGGGDGGGGGQAGSSQNVTLTNPTTFLSNLTTPVGIATDTQGNIYVHSDQPPTTTLLSKHSPTNGAFLGGLNFGGFSPFDFVGSNLARDPNTGDILLLSTQGVIFRVPTSLNPAQTVQIADLRPLAGVPQPNVFDVETAQLQSFIISNAIQYGDIAVRRIDASSMDVFVTLVSNGLKAVIRVRFVGQNPPQPRMIVMSSVSTAQALVCPSGIPLCGFNEAQGIAVNNQGTVLSALPRRVNTIIDDLVAFGADYNPGDQNPPSFVFGRDFTTRGMITDSAGNFYVVLSVVGSSACPSNSTGAIAVVPPQLNTFQCVPTSASLLSFAEDAAFSPGEDLIYITSRGGSLVGGATGFIQRFSVTRS